MSWEGEARGGVGGGIGGGAGGGAGVSERLSEYPYEAVRGPGPTSEERGRSAS